MEGRLLSAVLMQQKHRQEPHPATKVVMFWVSRPSVSPAHTDLLLSSKPCRDLLHSPQALAPRLDPSQQACSILVHEWHHGRCTAASLDTATADLQSLGVLRPRVGRCAREEQRTHSTAYVASLDCQGAAQHAAGILFLIKPGHLLLTSLQASAQHLTGRESEGILRVLSSCAAGAVIMLQADHTVPTGCTCAGCAAPQDLPALKHPCVANSHTRVLAEESPGAACGQTAGRAGAA